jgi:hypothetical protein
MEQPPLDPFAGYLEVVSVIGILELKRALILGSAAKAESQEGEGATLLQRVEEGIREALELQMVYEERIEDVLHHTADKADALRFLFDSISERMAQMQRWIEDAIEGLPEEDREEWDLLVSDYERIREQIGDNLPPDRRGPEFR